MSFLLFINIWSSDTDQHITHPDRSDSTNAPAIFTDGSYRTKPSLEAVSRPQYTESTASASIIIKDSTVDWMIKPVYIIHIEDGEELQATSAYTMEFLALAAALKLQTCIPEVNNGSVGVSPVRSDANSIVTMLKQRRQRLRQALKPYHLIL